MYHTVVDSEWLAVKINFRISVEILSVNRIVIAETEIIKPSRGIFDIRINSATYTLTEILNNWNGQSMFIGNLLRVVGIYIVKNVRLIIIAVIMV